MSYILKYTATRDTWGSAVKAGESFTVAQSTSGPNGQYLAQHIRKMGRSVTSSSSIGSGGMKVGESIKSNEWLIERIA
jgi:hypothetical protein